MRTKIALLICSALATSLLGTTASAQVPPITACSGSLSTATYSFPQGDIDVSLPTNIWRSEREIPEDLKAHKYYEHFCGQPGIWIGPAKDPRPCCDEVAASLKDPTKNAGFDPLFPSHWATGAFSYVWQDLPAFWGSPTNPNYWLGNQDPAAYSYGGKRETLLYRLSTTLQIDPLTLFYLFAYEAPPLELVKRPDDFAGEPIWHHRLRTFRVEVEVPAGPGGSKLEPPDPVKAGLLMNLGVDGLSPWLSLSGFSQDEIADFLRLAQPMSSVKLRGWYIQADLQEDEQSLGLVVLNGGRFSELTFPTRDVLRSGIRDVAARFALAGFDVFVKDARGHGISEGVWSSDAAVGADEIFRALQSFEDGIGLTVITPGGTKIPNEYVPSAAGLLLPAGHTAKTVPLLLWGQSQGAFVAQAAMAIHVLAKREGPRFERAFHDYFYPTFSSLPEGTDVSTPRDFYASFNLKGILTFDGWGAGQHTGLFPWLLLPVVTTNGWLGPSYFWGTSFPAPFWSYRTADLWPAHFQAHTTGDQSFAPETVVTLYNRERGLKEIVLVQGVHGETISGDPAVQEYVLGKAVKFARRAVHYGNDNLNNSKLTTLENELFRVVRTSRHFPVQ
jgi:hypothetical protein